MIKDDDESDGWSTNLRKEYEPGKRNGFYFKLYCFSSSFPILLSNNIPILQPSYALRKFYPNSEVLMIGTFW